MKFEDLTGKKFGRWLVINQDKNTKNSLTRWNCLCECGNKKSVVSVVLKDGRSKSCGCLWKENNKKSRVDIIGKKYGKLTVIKKLGNEGMWECECECGNKVNVYSSALYNGLTKSCGCLKKEKLSGSNSRFWKGGITNETRRKKHDPKLYKWSLEIRKRDKKTCQKCQSKEKLHAHHIINFSFDESKSLELENGIALCEKCHKLFHKIYGKIRNDREQLNEFLKNNL